MRETAAPLVPSSRSVSALREAAAGCKACELWKRGTQTVFGEGSRTAEILLVGEQPGDKEDLAGKPFVGPAGQLLDSALEEAGIDRRRSYVTNVVKHFKWTGKGKRRIHQKPNAAEVAACRPWLDAELEAVEPKVLVALGATAAQALLGRQFRLTRHPRAGRRIGPRPSSLCNGAPFLDPACAGRRVAPSGLCRLRRRSRGGG
jgi:uracil-DNA glycosylase